MIRNILKPPYGDSYAFFKSLCLSSIAFLPIILYWLFREYYSETSIWVFFDHIEVLYYISGIELSQGFIPSNVDNPGMPAQLISQILVGIIGVNPGKYEYFNHLAHLTLLLLSFLATVFLIHFAARNVDWRLRISCVWLFFSFSVSLTYLRVFGPEPFYYIVGVLSICALFNLARNVQKQATFSLFLFGASVGALLSVKLTFLAWLPGLCLISVLAAPNLISYQSVKNLMSSVVGVCVAFTLITYQIREAYPYMFGWVLKNAARDGTYGSGQASLPDLTQIAANWQTFIMSNKVWLVAISILIVLSVLQMFRIRKKSHDKGKILVLTFIMTSVAFSLMLVMRSYQHRYMLPIGLCGVALLLNYASVPPNKKSIITWSVMFIFLGMLLKSMSADYASHLQRQANSKAFTIEINAKLARQVGLLKLTDPVIVYGWRVPHPALSLRQHPVKGDYLKKVDALYPSAGHYTPWVENNTFRLPNNKTHWDLAVVNSNYLADIAGINYKIVDTISNYVILRSVK